MEPGPRPPQKYPWLRISGSGGQLSTHTAPLHNMHSFTIHHPGRGCCGAVGLDNNNNHSIISARPSFAASPCPECPAAALASHLPSQPSHFKDELIIHHTCNIYWVGRDRNNKTILAIVKLKQCWQQLVWQEWQSCVVSGPGNGLALH